ncbi:uncharacterized protein J8A68_003443 [[Candida] subhashii]|uniref:Zinc finger Mcm10/DnaG-type domain-containing protein n=1 Tax=[Candida] subhashii TaxID=561895 RepID=A0A8J5UM03_9ASCO|nr:uncharacterized protein J8A68_003443 [[Candida] subhashii]KAG7663016.1 hypothetical protein J8A68_003443 [[Candida] subhashii]
MNDMEDPRELHNEHSDDLLTEDSSDEYKDLMKEFQAKYDAIKQKKKARKEKQLKLQQQTREVSGSPSPSPAPVPVPKAIIPRSPSPDRRHKIQQKKSVYIPPINQRETKPKPSEKAANNFLNKLYDVSFQSNARSAQSIDYDKRRFEFNLTDYQFQPIDVTNDLEPITKQYLRKRYLTKDQFKRIIKETDPDLKFLKIDKLLAKVNKSNNYCEPMYTNWCLVGFVLNKSEVKIANKTNNKYCKLKVGNFQYSVDLMLFGGAVEKNHKVQPGDLIMVLNPIISKYELNFESNVTKTGFNLKIDDTNITSILEIGAIRDFGYCKHTNRQNNIRCTNVINPRNAELCDLHLDMKFKSSTRMELNGSIQMRSPQKTKQKMYMGSKAGTGYIRQLNEDTTITTMGGSTPDFQKFQDPKLLQTQVKRRKLLDERANEKLEKKLSNLPSSSLIDRLNLIKTKKPLSKVLEAEKTKEHGFSGSMISQIGFDPTSKPDNGKTSPSRKKKEVSRLQELYEISLETSKSRSLSSSKEDKQSKTKKWKENLMHLKEYEKNVSSQPLSTTNYTNTLDATFPPLIRKRNKHNMVPLDDDSDDDDIAIEFDNDDAKKQYAKMLIRNK